MKLWACVCVYVCMCMCVCVCCVYTQELEGEWGRQQSQEQLLGTQLKRLQDDLRRVHQHMDSGQREKSTLEDKIGDSLSLPLPLFLSLPLSLSFSTSPSPSLSPLPLPSLPPPYQAVTDILHLSSLPKHSTHQMRLIYTWTILKGS